MKQRIQVAQIPKPPQAPESPLRTLAKLCYFYPQYTLTQARRLPHKHVLLLLDEAARQVAARNHSLLEIVAAPYSDKGKDIELLKNHYRDIMNGN